VTVELADVTARPTDRLVVHAVGEMRTPGWSVALAAHGTAGVRPVPGLRAGIVITEAPREDPSPVPDGPEPAADRLVTGSRTEVRLCPDGEAVVRSVAAPPVLVIPATGGEVRPVDGVCGPVTVPVAAGGLLFVCSPGLLEALAPAELIAAPRLLRRSAGAPAVLLDRWLAAAERRGVAGAAVAVARFDGPDGPGRPARRPFRRPSRPPA